MSDLRVVVLAAGKGTRMRSDRPKVLHHLGGRPIIEHVLRTAGSLDAAEIILVVGHGSGEVQAALQTRPGLRFVVQSPQLGTGHALLQTAPLLEGARGTVLLLYGDVPLLESSTLRNLLEKHHDTGAAATVLTAVVPDPYGYGRIVRDDQRRIAAIVEERDASGEQRRIREVNSGIYAFDPSPLFGALRHLAADNAQGEYYLTDLVRIYRQRDLLVETLAIDNPAELRGVNSRVDLAELAAVVRARKCRQLMLDGVTIEDPAATYIDDEVTIGRDTIIGPGVVLSGQTRIGVRCRVLPGVRLADTSLGDDVQILDGCVISHSTIESGAIVGPFAHLRPGCSIGERARVGNFVELKKTRLGRGSKASHLSYLGDAVIGDDVNIGAGTITCNYDGRAKHQTVIEDGVFVGSDSQLIAPVTIGRGAYIAAGSSITSDVPPGSLALARARQVNKPGWTPGRQRGPGQESS